MKFNGENPEQNTGKVNSETLRANGNVVSFISWAEAMTDRVLASYGVIEPRVA